MSWVLGTASCLWAKMLGRGVRVFDAGLCCERRSRCFGEGGISVLVASTSV